MKLPPARRIALGLVTVLTIVFLVAPILVVIPVSFSPGEIMVFPPPSLSLRWYEAVVTDPVWTSRIPVSIAVALGASLLATLLGTLTALGLDRGRFRGKTVASALFITPLIVPLVVLAVGMYFVWVLGWGIGPLRLGGHLEGTLPGLILAHTVLALPYPIVTVLNSLRTVDPTFDLAAANLGAPPWRSFQFVTLPLILPGMVAGVVFAFLVSWDEVVVATFLSTSRVSTVPVEVWAQIRDTISPAAAAISVILLCVSTLLLSTLGVLGRRRGLL